MSSIYGKNIKASLFGESHGEAIGLTIDGLKAGLKLDLERIKEDLNKRKAKREFETKRSEKDEFKIISGFFNGYTTGAPLTIIIENTDVESLEYQKNKTILRPSHADYVANAKYEGFQDYRGGGAFSGRLTALLVIMGSISRSILEKQNIFITSHIKEIYGVVDDDFDYEKIVEEANSLKEKEFATLSEKAKEDMLKRIDDAKIKGDSVGGVIEAVIFGDLLGLGEPFFGSVEAVLSSLIFSVPAVKGVEFGLGFAFKDTLSSEVNDSFYFDNKVKTRTNNNGGINGGIANGMPIIVRSVIKPTPSISKPQKTLNLDTLEECIIELQGRYDSCIVPRAIIVIESVIAFGLLDLLISKNKNDWMKL